MRISRRFITSFLKSATCWVGIVVSLIAALLVAQMIQEKNEVEFEYQSNHAEVAIRARMKSYIDVLRGLRAFFYANDNVSRELFHAYVQRLETEQSFPGIVSLNFAPRVFAYEKIAFERKIIQEIHNSEPTYPDFAIKPPGNRRDYHPLIYQEPMASNPQNWGFDIASLPRVRRALEISRDTGELSASGQLIKYAGKEQRIALAMRLPLYHRGMPLDTIEQRRAAYYGTVGAGFDLIKLMLGAVDNSILRYMRIRLYDTGRIDEEREVGTTRPDRLLFDSANPQKHKIPAAGLAADGAFSKRVPIEIGARIWEAEFVADKTVMHSPLDAILPGVVFFLSFLAALLLYSIYYSLSSARGRAVVMANDMTKDLRASEASLEEAQHMAHLGSWTLDPATRRMSWSNETCRIFGMQQPAALSLDDFLHQVHEEDRPLLQDGLLQAIELGTEFALEHRILRGEHDICWVHTIARPSHGQNGTLLRGTIMDITERKATMEALERSREMLRDLTAYQERVKEDERKRIAREIHDELGQTLLALRLDVAMLDNRTGASHPRLNAKVQAVLGHIDATMKTIRTIINNLRPAVLDLGLIAAIEWQVAEFERRGNIAYELVISDLEEVAVDDECATTLFRVLQESLTNVIRHASASQVSIELYPEDEHLVMQVADNGIGIYSNDRRKSNSFGLLGMEERINALHGTFSIASVPGKGTRLTVLIPLRAGGRRPAVA